MSESPTYVVGGDVAAGAGTYIERAVDRELVELCRAGEYAYILAPRQVGKTSVMRHTAAAIEHEDVRTVQIDLSDVKSATAEEWFRFILVEIASQLDLAVDPMDWWNGRGTLGNAPRFRQFIEEEVLRIPDRRVVIFVDEIDGTVGLGFAADFFASVRKIYQERGRKPLLRQISFVLLGSISQSDIISDRQRTPYNIGRAVEITDFTREEALPLAGGLGLANDREASNVLGWIMAWTAGQPYLTQKLCYEFRRHNCLPSEAAVNDLVGRLFFGQEANREINLQTVRDMLLKGDVVDPALTLPIYRDILRGRRVQDEERSPAKSHLKLAGVVKRSGGLLVPRNPIYSHVFDEAWVAQNMPPQTRWEQQIKRLLRVSGVAIAALIGLVVVAIYINSQRVAAVQATRKATQLAAQLKDEVDRANQLAKERADALKQAVDARALADKKAAEATALAADLHASLTREQTLSGEISKRAEDLKNANKALVDANEKANTAAAEAVSSANTTEQQRKIAQAAADEAAKERDKAEENRRNAAIALAKTLAAQTMSTYPLNAEDANLMLWRSLYSVWVTLEKDKTVTPEAAAALSLAARWFPLERGYSGSSSLAFKRLISINDAGTVTQIFVDAGPPGGITRVLIETPGLPMVDASNGGISACPPGPMCRITASALSVDGRHLATGDDRGNVRLFVISSDSVPPDISDDRFFHRVHNHAVDKLAFGPDGRYFASSSVLQILRVIDAATGKTVWHRPREGYLARIFQQEQVFGNPIRSFTFSPDGALLAVAYNQVTSVFNAKNGTSVRPDIQKSADSLAFWRNSLLFTSGGEIVEVPLAGARPPFTDLEHQNRTGPLVSSTRSELLISAGSRSWISLDGNSRFESADLGSTIAAVASAPNGTRFVTVGADGGIRVWSEQRVGTTLGLLKVLNDLPNGIPTADTLHQFEVVLQPLRPEQCEAAFGSRTCPVFH